MNPLNTGAGQAFRMYSEEQTEYYERKMKHYNAWLKNNFMAGKPYPGFPEDTELLRKIENEKG